jgi:transposase
MRRHRHKPQPLPTGKAHRYFHAHPALEAIYRFKQRLCYLLLKKHRSYRQCQTLAPRFLCAVYQLRQAGLAQLVQLGDTLNCWSEEVVAMWRFTRNNGITEGFHNKMELITGKPMASATSKATNFE